MRLGRNLNCLLKYFEAAIEELMTELFLKVF